jgi:structure-specific recognition protein 1
MTRVGGGVASAKTFDMRVVSKTDNVDHVFSAISKEEVQPISNFLQSKNVRLKNEMEEVMDIEPISDDDEEDDDVSIPSEDERPKKSKDKTSKKPARANNDDDDESGQSFFSCRCQADWCRRRIFRWLLVRRWISLGI